MLLAIDVYYKEQRAKVVGALFQWEDVEPIKIISCQYNKVLPYEPGNFYKRELPCILELLKQVKFDELQAIIVDGHCYIDNNKNFGLGGFLWKSLDKKIPVIGVAKKSFYETDKVSFPIYRGKSNSPLFVSSIDYNTEEAIENIKNMHGVYRMPEILKTVDQLTRLL
ncbi:MAG: endonuclease V [Flavobacteriales bacterium]|jgi:deoxyribonuclease V|nr:endonuclease V [Flavobacteriales bacterium]